jgi:GNAT superfamily N-acetyltransferase
MVIAMALATWWRGDALPPLPPLPGFRAAITDDETLLAELAGLPAGEVRNRIRNAHRPYLAWIGSTPVAYGWSAVTRAEVGEYSLAFRLASANRYLWDFATLPAWRGIGVYPRLLQAIVTQERADAGRFWIIHLPENTASGRGIQKAGLRSVGDLVFLPAGRVGLVSNAARARAGAAVLGVSVVAQSAPPVSLLYQLPIAG